jgi:hypothetical protein
MGGFFLRCHVSSSRSTEENAEHGQRRTRGGFGEWNVDSQAYKMRAKAIEPFFLDGPFYRLAAEVLDLRAWERPCETKGYP